jgi:hypothetical protein
MAMRGVRQFSTALGTILVLAVWSQPLLAGDTKKFSGRGTLVVVEMNELPVTGKADIKPSLIRMDGTLLTDDRAHPLNGARYQVVDVYDGKDRDMGYKTFTTADGSMLFGTYEVTEANHPKYKGTIKITGGTGIFKDATGQGKFVNTFIADKVGIDDVDFEYTTP